MTAVDFIEGRSHVLVSDSAFFNDKSVFSYNVENFLISKGVFNDGKSFFLNDDFDENFVKKRKNVVTFGKKIIGMSDGSDFFKERLSYRIPLDYMLVYGQKRQSLTNLLKIYDFDNLIISSDIPAYLADKLINEADALGIKYHNIRKNGAYFVK